MYVIDASVAYKWFINEEGSDRAKTILDDFSFGKTTISAPDLLYYEVANALRWNPRNTPGDVKEVIANLDDLGLDIVIPTPDLLQDAVDMAYEYALTFYDALYLKLADDLKFTFITADKKLYEKAKGLSAIKLL